MSTNDTTLAPLSAETFHNHGSLDPIYSRDDAVWLKLRFEREHEYPVCEDDPSHPLQKQLAIVGVMVREDPKSGRRAVLYAVKNADCEFEFEVWQVDLIAKEHKQFGPWGLD